MQIPHLSSRHVVNIAQAHTLTASPSVLIFPKYSVNTPTNKAEDILSNSLGMLSMVTIVSSVNSTAGMEKLAEIKSSHD